MNNSMTLGKRRGKPTPGNRNRADITIGIGVLRLLCVIGMLIVVVGTHVFLLADIVPRSPESSPKFNGISPRDAALADIPQVQFTDVTTAAGISFVHQNGARGEKLLPETMGGGCAFFDYDSDGDQDLLFVNSQSWLNDGQAATNPPATMALYRNDGRGNFEDVTAGSGLDVASVGMGAAVGDYDNDGRVDVFLSAVGANRLFHNRGEGKFVEVTDAAGVAGEANQWSTGSGWFDYDKDGDLDLFVCNYVKWTCEYDLKQGFRLPGGQPAYGRPQNFEGAFPYLYRNDGSGQFTDVSQQAGIEVSDPVTGKAMSKALGVTFDDFDGDGWLDVVVANDTVQNQLFRNRSNGTFEEVGALAGIAFDGNGNVRGAMGIDAARFRNDDALGIAVGNFSNEMMALYVTDSSSMQFVDQAVASGLGASTRSELTFGTCFVDYDLDGYLDLFAANGHLEPAINSVQPSQQYAQPPQLFWNGGSAIGGRLLAVSGQESGPDFAQPTVGRGASFADIDGDGDLDLLIAANGRAPRLLRNDQALGHHWLRLKLVGSSSNRDAIGAEVQVELQDRTLRRRVMPTRSYLSQVELPLTFGLGTEDIVQSVTIHWPDGSQQILQDVQVDRSYEIEQGGKSVARLSSQPHGTSVAMATEQSGRDGQSFLMPGASTSCGDYLHISDRATVGDGRGSPPARTCHGPLCSNSPSERHAPPPGPRRTSQQQQDAIASVVRPPVLANLCGHIATDSEALPSFVSGRVFRPPRGC
ncbi:MAG: CRTAC1 family protein [Planctomycetales bacterium]|nr:CRTAC1 family protein [Planctomycetales bacterium]